MKRIASELYNADWEVTVLCPKRNNQEPPNDGINYLTFSYPEPTRPITRLLNSVRGAKTFWSYMKEYAYDVVLDDVSPIPFFPAHIFHSEEAINVMFLHVAYLDTHHTSKLISKSNVTVKVHSHLSRINDPLIICAGPSTEDKIQKKLNHEKTDVLSPCVDTEKYEFTFNPNSRRILYLGRLTDRKNVSCLLNAWNEIQEEFHTYTLTIAGTGPKEQSLKQQSERLGIGNIEFKGYVTDREKKQLYNQSLLYVLPSRLEGYATVGLEALAAGTPVIGADTAGINDYIVSGETGYLFESDNPEHLAAMLRQALSAPKKLEQLAKNGRAVAENHSCEDFGKKADNIFTKIINNEY